jgi:predicted dehydrogenase
MAIRIGIIGTGNIFPAYLRTLAASKRIQIVGVGLEQLPDRQRL